MNALPGLFQKHFWRLHGEVFLWRMSPREKMEGFPLPCSLFTVFFLFSSFSLSASTLSWACSNRRKVLLLLVSVCWWSSHSLILSQSENISTVLNSSSFLGFLLCYVRKSSIWIPGFHLHLPGLPGSEERGCPVVNIFHVTSFFSLGDRVWFIFIYPLLINKCNIH